MELQPLDSDSNESSLMRSSLRLSEVNQNPGITPYLSIYWHSSKLYIADAQRSYIILV